MASVNEIIKKWQEAGKPTDMDGVHDVLMNFMEHEPLQQVFASVGLNLPDSAPEEEAPEEVVPEAPKFNVTKGSTVKTANGDKVVYNGDRWIFHGAKGQQHPVAGAYVEKVEAAYQRQRQAQQEASAKAKQDKIDAKTARDEAKYSFEGDPVDSVDAQDVKNAPSAEHLEKAQQMADNAETVQTSTDELSKLAMKIQSSPHKGRIKKLLADNSPMAKMAVQLLLSGEANAAKKAINSRY